jgi:cbb3-type cytochrome oxidase subunit 3
MTYETILGICQLVAMLIFGSVMAGILVHVLRPKNKAHFAAAARMALNDDHFDARLRRDLDARLRRDTTEKPHGR